MHKCIFTRGDTCIMISQYFNTNCQRDVHSFHVSVFSVVCVQCQLLSLNKPNLNKVISTQCHVQRNIYTNSGSSYPKLSLNSQMKNIIIQECKGGKCRKFGLRLCNVVVLAEKTSTPLQEIHVDLDVFEILMWNSILVRWKSNRKSWMTNDIFTEWDKDIIRKMR